MSQDIIHDLTADLLKSLGHPARVKILKHLASEEKCVCSLIEDIDIEQSNLSQHLSVLKKQGLIVSRKEGTKVIYRLMYSEVLTILDATEKILSQRISQSQSILEHLC